jgi:MFS family permease
MTRIAVAWLIVRITNSVLWLGVIGFTGQIPVLLLAPLAGSAIDRWGTRNTLLVTQVFASIQAFTLAYFAFSQHISFAHLVVLSVVRGCISAFDIPARTALVPVLAANPKDQSGMLALDSVVVNLCRVAGPSLAGLLLARFGEAICFLIDGGSYAASLAALLMIRERGSAPASTNHACSWREGWTWLGRYPKAKSSLIMLCITSLIVLPFTVLLPFHVKNVLQTGPQTLGALGAVSSVAAIIASCIIASLCNSGSKIAISYAGMIGAGIALIGLSLSDSLVGTFVAVFVVSFSIMIQAAATNVYIQSVTTDRLRGRITAFYSAAFWGVVPLGSLLLGAFAFFMGSSAAFASGGVLCLWGALAVGIHFRSYTQRTVSKESEEATQSIALELSVSENRS